MGTFTPALEQVVEQAAAAPSRLNDRCLAGFGAFPEGGVLAQALRLFLRVHHDPWWWRLAPEYQPIGERLVLLIQCGILVDGSSNPFAWLCL